MLALKVGRIFISTREHRTLMRHEDKVNEMRIGTTPPSDASMWTRLVLLLKRSSVILETVRTYRLTLESMNGCDIAEHERMAYHAYNYSIPVRSLDHYETIRMPPWKWRLMQVLTWDSVEIVPSTWIYSSCQYHPITGWKRDNSRVSSDRSWYVHVQQRPCLARIPYPNWRPPFFDHRPHERVCAKEDDDRSNIVPTDKDMLLKLPCGALPTADPTCYVRMSIETRPDECTCEERHEKSRRTKTTTTTTTTTSKCPIQFDEAYFSPLPSVQ
jgi:hypothetical protein